MNILGYLLVWGLFFAIAISINQINENKQLKKQLRKTAEQEQYPRRFRSITV